MVMTAMVAVVQVLVAPKDLAESRDGSPLPPFSRAWASRRYRRPSSPSKRATLPPRLLGALALMRDPSDLDGESLGHAAGAAAREGLDNDSWWEAFFARARELVPELTMHDAALILNGMARSRQLDKEFVKMLLPRICTHLVYLTSAHLAMMSSAIAKAEVHDPKFVNLLTRELKARIMEFHSPMEMTMMLNAASKLRITDANLYHRFVAHIQSRVGQEAFHVRDLSVIASAVANVNTVDVSTISRFADCALETLPEATPLELARLMQAFMAVSCTVNDFFSACVQQSRLQLSSMDPGGLSNAAYAFGQCFEVAELEHLPYLQRVLRHVRVAAIRSLPLFLPREIMSLLHTCARWQVTFESERLQKVADRMMLIRDQFDIESSVSALYSLAILMQRNVVRSAETAVTINTLNALRETSRLLLAPIWHSFRNDHKLKAITVLRAIEASVILRPEDTTPIQVVTLCLVHQVVDLDASNCSALYELLRQLKCSPEEDVMLALTNGMQSGGSFASTETSIASSGKNFHNQAPVIPPPPIESNS